MSKLERLDDYVTGTMPDDEAAGFEEELFAAAAKGEDEEARWFERFQLLMSWFAKDGLLVRGTTAEDVDALVAAGLKVHVVELEADKTLAYEEKDVDIVVTHVPLDVRGYDDVIATIERPDGRVLHTFRDCMSDPKTGHLYAICAAPLANLAWGGGPRVTRVTGVRRAPGEPADSRREELATEPRPPADSRREELAVYRLEPARP